MPTNTYVALRTEVLTSAVPSVTFNLSGITGYTDLVLVYNGTNSTVDDGILAQFNGDTASNYSSTIVYGTGSSAVTGRLPNSQYAYVGRAGSVNSTSIISFMNYANTNTFKTTLGRGNVSNGIVIGSIALWRKTPIEAITSIRLINESGQNFQTGSTFTIYGIANADNFAKATGGIIREDATYWYHVFGANGTFTPKQSLSCDVLVVAGGGGGGANMAGGGAAGGLLAFTSQSLTATNYTCTVGGGGAGSTDGSVSRGANGANSSFTGLTAAVGGGGGGSLASPLQNGSSGGSGGGGAGGYATGTGGTGGAATSGQGFAGGAGASGSANQFLAGAGGGGAGAIGANGSGNASSAIGGAGGIGSSTYSSWGLATGIGQISSGIYYLAGGGGGGVTSTSSSPGAGGIGGGGAGGSTNGYNGGINSPQAGVPNTGGGGGGGNNGGTNGTIGAPGGSGVVIIRYLKA
jgi:hypothetical protein